MKFAATFGLFLVLISAGPAAAQLAPYWIPSVGCEIVCGTSPTSLEYRFGTAGPLSLWHTTDHFDYTIERYAWDGANGLCRTQDDHPGMDSYYFTYTPPLKVLELPLITGATWTSDSVRTYHGDSHIMTRAYHLVTTVVGPRTVETGIGTLDVIEVTCHLTMTPGPAPTTTTLLLNDQFGDVTNLVSIDGCAVVSSEVVSWGQVKGLYR